MAKEVTRGDAPDAVNHPAHYGGADNPYEAIKVVEAWELDFCLGNAIKYIARRQEGRYARGLEESAVVSRPRDRELGEGLRK